MNVRLAWCAATAALSAIPRPALTQETDSSRIVPVEVAPIVVTTTRTAEPVERLPIAVTILRGDELGDPAPLDGIDGVLGAVPGVYVANRYNFSLDQRLSIRGFGSRANFGSRGVRVLLDGVPQTLPDGQTQFTNIELEDIERVEVLRGAASALHGNASGGVIAFRTSGAGPAAFAQRVGVEGGAFGTLKWHSRTSARRGAWSGAVSLSRLTSGGFRAHSETDQRQVNGFVELQLTPATVAALRIAAADQPIADNPGALTSTELAADRRAAAPNNLAADAGKSVDQQQLSLQVRHRDGSGEYGAVAYMLWRGLANPLATGVNVGLDRAVAGARIDASRLLGARDAPRLTGGLDLQRMRDDRTNERDGTLIVDQLDRVTEVGPFVQLDWSPLPRLLLEAGMRYDRSTFEVEDRLLADGDDGGQRVLAAWSARGGATVEAGRGVRAYASVATAFETPTTTELGNRPDGTGGLNPELGPQRALAFEVGARGRTGAVEWSAAAFTSSIRDAITQFEEVGGRAFFRNAGRVRQRGVEGSAALRPIPIVQLSVVYTFADYRFTDYESDGISLDGRRLPGVPLHHARARVEIVPGNWSGSIEHAMSSRVWADDANTLAAEGWGTGVTDLRVRWTGRAGALTLSPFVTIQNLTDREYVGSVTINGFNGRVFEPAPGRHFVAGIEGSFAVLP
ncbi:MAG TPA: TonB-dependent receptor [Gemmatimonadales bacterium]|nr:TonB-dependent receptor [Gemmatimonadales bacterium]